MAETETPSPKGKGRSRPSTLARVVMLTVLCLAGGVVCAGAITIKTAVDKTNAAKAQARELQRELDDKINAAEELRPKIDDAGAWPLRPVGKPVGPGDFGPLYPRQRGSGGRPCNCPPGDPLCQCF